MSSVKCHLTFALSSFAIGAALVLISADSIQAADTIDDPVRQPHLKSWSNIIPNAAKRFVVLSDFNNEAVLDRETGLVWEQSPSPVAGGWPAARLTCTNRNVGNRAGWRLPSVAELSSLQDRSLQAPFIANVFSNIQSASYWSGSTDVDTPTSAWAVEFSNGTAFNATKVGPNYFAWRARGPMNVGAY